jgi:hypothetical protein
LSFWQTALTHEIRQIRRKSAFVFAPDAIKAKIPFAEAFLVAGDLTIDNDKTARAAHFNRT